MDSSSASNGLIKIDRNPDMKKPVPKRYGLVRTVLMVAERQASPVRGRRLNGGCNIPVRGCEP
jgi:hypothetical protein